MTDFELYEYSENKLKEKEKCIAKLKKENKELKNRNQELLESCEGATMMYKDLCSAKELVRRLYDWVCGRGGDDLELLEQTEKFLKEVK